MELWIKMTSRQPNHSNCGCRKQILKQRDDTSSYVYVSIKSMQAHQDNYIGKIPVNLLTQRYINSSLECKDNWLNKL